MWRWYGAVGGVVDRGAGERGAAAGLVAGRRVGGGCRCGRSGSAETCGCSGRAGEWSARGWAEGRMFGYLRGRWRRRGEGGGSMLGGGSAATVVAGVAAASRWAMPVVAGVQWHGRRCAYLLM